MSLSLKIHPTATRILDAQDDLLPDFVRSCIEEHGRQLAVKSGSVMKDSPESAVTLVEIAGFPTVCVKEFRWRGWRHAIKGLFRPTQGWRTYRNGWRLTDARVGAAAPLAYVREKRAGLTRSEWVVMEVIPHATEMDRYILGRERDNWPISEKREFTVLFGRFIGCMHAAGIFHSDLKTCNILISRDALPRESGEHQNPRACAQANLEPHMPRFFLLDYDAVREYWEVPERKRIKNLLQIFLSTPLALRATDRLRFLGEYALHMGLTPEERRNTARAVLAAARGKEILYVGFDGDVKEQWER
ncbi:MAG: hypothetical protein HY914_17365 [Desulfomonile tiedjei]|nr:hypothetical protein [Desulfomonile tiedjei]